MQKIDAARNGSPLLEVFYDQRSRLIGLAARITGCRSHAEDIVHEAFMKVDDAGDNEQIRSQASYLTRVVRNLSIDHYRRRQFEERLICQDSDSNEAPAHHAETPEALVSDQQLLERVCGALADLPERTRYVFEMCRIHGMKQKDIARDLGVSAPLVSAMIREALLHCREKAL
ncbi:MULTISPECIES: RNA polymerase factor sigma-70 [unclassified Pseudomonas]|jgi:RNA polymerase sigma-70 factor (ECF subfamily)|uniref:RNA polymerase factor sigma-70 n=1 Tax=unclassified Pseudomonas TaxID=196821 RepID=UPI000BA4B730|nr:MULTISPECIES: RNA polymerase factor sigma-70 [unclassified Pseudomonas]MDX9668496.1 RNA polymerase factor sigma-70 [Pseudomonas sp. P5_152]QHD01240.1 RNA polymerase factor sigma-70 [Pseudomonas sp. S04]QHF33724.1 RNA polymerase factor sigma-70 [Pseudomonas sp. S19]